MKNIILLYIIVIFYTICISNMFGRNNMGGLVECRSNFEKDVYDDYDDDDDDDDYYDDYGDRNQKVRNYDPDEFEDYDATKEELNRQKYKDGNKRNGRLKSFIDATNADNNNNANNTNEQDNYYYEVGAIGILIWYIALFFIGRKENSKIVANYLKVIQPTLAKQFYKLGAYDVNTKDENVAVKPDGILLKDSENSYKIYASGRRNCKGILITLDLQKRQDLLSSLILSKFNLSEKDDVINIDIPMISNVMEPFIFAIVPRKEEKKLRRNVLDLGDYTRVVKSKKLPDKYVVLTDSKEVIDYFISGNVEHIIRKNKKYLHSIHLTDQNTNSLMNKKVLHFKFILPKMVNKQQYEQELEKINELTKMSLVFIDMVAQLSLSARTKQKNLKIRKIAEEERSKELQARQREDRQSKKKEKVDKKKNKMKRVKAGRK